MATEASLRPNETGARAHNLPLPVAALVGRGRELEGITGILGKARLVTITGPGGVGKTRLALEIAHRHAARRPDGAWLVDLTAGPERPDVAAETARALGVRAAVGTADTDALRAYLSERDLMLVLDNCEHVIEQSAALGAELLGSCANVRIVATSREPLAIAGETTWTLDPLEPDSAYRLFVERARQRRPDFIPDEADEGTIAHLCDRLDRLPLAIELAAARIGVASPAEILASLETRPGEFGGGGRFAAPRHRTVRASVEWSYQLLSSKEREAVRRLAVFVGGFDAAAAVAVVPGLGFDELARLVDKSLVAATRSPRGDTRYRLLESVRELAHELLVETEGLDAAEERHLRHFSSLCADVREGWPAADADTFVSAVGDDYENVRAAIEWAVAANPAAAMALVGKGQGSFLHTRTGGRGSLGGARARTPSGPRPDARRGADHQRAALHDAGERPGCDGRARGCPRSRCPARRALARGMGDVLPGPYGNSRGHDRRAARSRGETGAIHRRGGKQERRGARGRGAWPQLRDRGQPSPSHRTDR